MKRVICTSGYFLKIYFLIKEMHGKLIQKLLIFPMSTCETVENLVLLKNIVHRKWG